jgi:hypothetical protein
MATRARIGIELADGTVRSSYHHWDGYPAGLGYNLVENWNDRDKLMQAIELGDASHWGDRVGEKCDFDNRDTIPEGQNVYYGRDRGETGVKPVDFKDVDTFLNEYDVAGEEYAYVLTRDGLWVLNCRYAKKTYWDAEYEIREQRERLDKKIA